MSIFAFTVDLLLLGLTYIRGREPMARQPYVALLITASGSFVDKHKLAHIKKNLRTRDFKSEDLFLRDHYVFKTKTEKSESDSR